MPFISNGTTILDNGAFSVSLGGLTYISTHTGSDVSSIDITSNIDSTYPIYKFEVTNFRSQSGANCGISFSTNGGSTFNDGTSKTTTAFACTEEETGGEAPSSNFRYSTSYDIAASSSRAYIGTIDKGGIHTGTDGGMAGEIYLFNPSSSTYAKHFMSHIHSHSEHPGSNTCYVAGYCNITTAIDAVRFDALAQNCSGTIKMYGIKGS